jgi:hypothetical protein
MPDELTAVFEQYGRWYVAHCYEISEEGGPGGSREECLADLQESIAFIQECQAEDLLKDLEIGDEELHRA